jgi:glycosyltransferase involved in cell wall biosynthesis
MSIKVLHLSSFDMTGGAARAAYRIHQGLTRLGMDSQMLVQFKSGHDHTIKAAEGKIAARLRSVVDSAPLHFTQQQELFSLQWVPNTVAARVSQIQPDIVHLNWVGSGFVQIESLAKLKQPLVWTLQDMWVFTGGCHYSLGCNQYQSSCGACPQLRSKREFDLSRWVWRRKAESWKNLNLTLVAPSQWMAKSAQAASLGQGLPIEIIPFGLDTTVFKPLAPQTARELLNLPQNKHLILFGAISATNDQRKGFQLLQSALKRLSQAGWQEQTEIVIFGASTPEKPLDLGFKTHYLGHLNDAVSLRLAYAAADLMIAPSIEEAFGQTASEALACGTPAVVFENTGLMDIVDHRQTGYVAGYCDIEDLARGIAWVLENKQRHQNLRIQARQKAEKEFSLEAQAHSYQILYQRILGQSPAQNVISAAGGVPSNLR